MEDERNTLRSDDLVPALLELLKYAVDPVLKKEDDDDDVKRLLAIGSSQNKAVNKFSQHVSLHWVALKERLNF